MKLRDFASQITIDPAKLTIYALNENHPHGKHKARVFAAALGYTTENYRSLLQQIEVQALEAKAELQHVDQFGQHFRVHLTITGVAGQVATIRTGWLVPSGDQTAILTTLYVIGAGEHD